MAVLQAQSRATPDYPAAVRHPIAHLIPHSLLTSHLPVLKPVDVIARAGCKIGTRKGAGGKSRIRGPRPLLFAITVAIVSSASASTTCAASRRKRSISQLARTNPCVQDDALGTMHFAYPPRKSSNPPPFRQRSSTTPMIRRSRLKIIAIGALLFFGLLYLLFGGRRPDPYHEHVPSGNPSVVLVTVVDPSEAHSAYLDPIKENRERYAARHGECLPSYRLVPERSKIEEEARRWEFGRA